MRIMVSDFYQSHHVLQSSLPKEKCSPSSCIQHVVMQVLLPPPPTDADCPAPTMMVSPHSQTPVEGIANISRYICREYFPALYEEGQGGAESASLVDSWLDLMTTALQRGSSKEKASVLRRLNGQLGSSQFLVGGQPSVADIIGFCAICEQPGMKLPGNVKPWLQRVQRSFPGLAGVPCSYLAEDTS